MTKSHSKILSLLLMPCLLVGLVGCQNPKIVMVDAENQCPHIGINVFAPNYFMKHKPNDVEGFYGCMEQALHDDPSAPGGVSERLAPFMADLEYQKNLWRQIFGNEKSPAAAQQAWMQWVQNNNAISAQEDAARATWAANRLKQTTCVQNGRYLNCYEY